ARRSRSRAQPSLGHAMRGTTSSSTTPATPATPARAAPSEDPSGASGAAPMHATRQIDVAQLALITPPTSENVAAPAKFSPPRHLRPRIRAPSPLWSPPRPGGGIGRHGGLKIPFFGVRVQVPPRALV